MTTPKVGVLKRLDGDFVMFDSGITIKDLINEIIDETDIALPVPINNIVNIYDGFMQKLYRTIVRHTDVYKVCDNNSNALPYNFSEFNAYDIYKIYDKNMNMEEVVSVSNNTYNTIKSAKKIYTVLNNSQILIDGGAFISIGYDEVIYNGSFEDSTDGFPNDFFASEAAKNVGFFKVSQSVSYSGNQSLAVGPLIILDNNNEEYSLSQSLSSQVWTAGDHVLSFKMKFGDEKNNITGASFSIFINKDKVFTFDKNSYSAKLNNGWYEYRKSWSGLPDNITIKFSGANLNYYIDDLSLRSVRYHIYYYKTPPRTECDDSGVVSDNTVPVPLAFIDMVKAKMRAELYLLVNETGLASNWIVQYNKLLEDFKAFCESARPSIM